VTGYHKGDNARDEMDKIRASVARAGTAMLAWPDVLQAFEDAGKLGDLGREISTEASQFRAYLAARLVDDRGMNPSQLAQILDLTPARVSQLVKDGRKQRRNPMTDPGTLAEQPTVALAIITSPRGVLIEHRKDGIPPWTFPGGEVQPGETAAGALVRKVPAETGIQIKPVLLFGRRIHPRTGRTMVYLAAEAEDDSTDPQVLDNEDLDAVEWVGLDAVRERMPDMYPPVKEHLEGVLGGSGQQ
jgi:8-oxo-dGTP pyrophosphatase MutT (NUDIX family)